jgi:predicted metal-binding membrane protein
MLELEVLQLEPRFEDEGSEWLLVFLLLVIVLALSYQYSKLKGQVESRAAQLFSEWRERAHEATCMRFGGVA